MKSLIGLLVLICLGGFALANPQKPTFAGMDSKKIKVSHFAGEDQVELNIEGKVVELRKGGHAGPWTLVEIFRLPDTHEEVAALEDFSQRNGRLLFVNERGVQLDLPKSSEPTFGDASKLYLGHRAEEVMASAKDLLGNEILSKTSDPDYEEVAAIFEPIRNMNTYSFVGTHETIDKVGVFYGGRTPNFDPAPYSPSINQIRKNGKVWDGLVGGYSPVLRFVYPEKNGDWTEMLAFAPLRVSNGNTKVQPVWYRVSRIERGELKWAKYIDSYHPFPPRTEYDSKIFYQDLVALHGGWERMLAQGIQLHVPDERVENMAKFSIIRELMTRVGDFPKYGVYDRDYAGSEHDGFPDTFTVDTTAMLEWGLIDLAGRYIDNYFGEFVRDDGSLLYRGPETGQYGRMLTVAAQYFNYGGDADILIKRRKRIDGVTKILLNLREKAKSLNEESAAYGMIAGWSEADASLDPDPPRYMQPYFSNSTEAARGFRDLGKAWEKIGKEKNDAELVSWGQRLQREAKELRADVVKAISRSMLTLDGEKILPSIAGVKEPFHVVVPRDQTDPQYRSYRAYMEMMYSGSLNKEQVKMIADYRANHHDAILGVPTAYGYNTGIMAGFLSYGVGYGLLQHDMVREYLLLLYSVMAHQYTRGTWTAPETRKVLPDAEAAPYCTPAQLVAPLMTRWMLAFDDPESETLWLGKGVPREWLQDGKTTSISGVTTRWGKVSFAITSRFNAGIVDADVELPAAFPATTVVRLRAPGQEKMKAVSLNGKPWEQFNAETETITIPAGITGKINLEARYR
jgi:hypothetical protein